jgi:hydrogenase nickel incorporation protein HypA/HybF
MHDRALMRDLLAHIAEVADGERATRVSRISVRLGALSHFTPGHFREHFAEAAAGTLAEGAAVEATLDDDPEAATAHGVVLESVEVEG